MSQKISWDGGCLRCFYIFKIAENLLLCNIGVRKISLENFIFKKRVGSISYSFMKPTIYLTLEIFCRICNLIGSWLVLIKYTNLDILHIHLPNSEGKIGDMIWYIKCHNYQELSCKMSSYTIFWFSCKA